MYPQGVCRIRKPACAGNGCAIFPTFNTAQLGKKIRCSAEDDLFRGSLIFAMLLHSKNMPTRGGVRRPLYFFDQSMLS